MSRPLWVTRRAAWTGVLGALASTVACASFFEYPVASDETGRHACANGVDDDYDGLVDCRDDDCADECSETTAERCTNGRDDDGDGDIDCGDSGCAAHCAESGEAACRNEQDDDADGLVDCADPGCDGHCPEADAATCSNGRDDDGDGLADAEDPGCWAVLPPALERCAATPPLTAAFLMGESDDRRFAPFGSARNAWSPTVPARGERRDAALRFPLPGHATEGIVTSLPGGFTTRETYPLASGFTLGASIRVDERSWARLELVPSGLARDGETPAEGAETALSIELDARARPRTATLWVQGRKAIEALSDPPEDGFYVVEVSGREARVEAEIRGAATTRLAGDVEGGVGQLAESRLVLRGGAAGLVDPTGTVGFARRWDAMVDDVTLDLPAHEPCGVAVPSVPSAAACLDDDTGSAGYTVAVARGAGWSCALLAGSTDETLGPTWAAAWRTQEGLEWEGPAPAAGPGAGDAGAPWVATFGDRPGHRMVGAGVAWDGERFVAALAWADGTGVELETTSSPDCWSWTEPDGIDGGPLPPDVEAPSRVAGGAFAPHEIWFTRPPTDDTSRTLWRLDSQDGLTWTDEPIVVTELSTQDQVAAPVAVQRLGGHYVATHRIAASASVSGLGVLVAGSTARDFARAGSFPLVTPTGGSLDFDGAAVLAGALVWPPEGAWLLYGGRGDDGNVRAGMALLGRAGERPTPTPRPAPPIPDGGLDAPAQGDRVVLTETFDAPEDAATVYGLTASGTLAAEAAPGVAAPPYLVALPDGQAVTGDFELSVRLLVPTLVPAPSTEVGLSTRSTAMVGANPGAYLRVQQDCGPPDMSETTHAVNVHPFVVLRGGTQLAPPDCGGIRAPVGRWLRLTLRRVGNVYDVRGDDERGCALVVPADVSVAPLRALGPLDAVAISPGSPGVVLLDDLQVRALDADCEASGRTPCAASGPAGEACVDTATSPDHCGACGATCDGRASCVAGTCTCDPGLTKCPARCADLLADDENCGACGKACGPAEACAAGACRSSSSCGSAIPIDAGVTVRLAGPTFGPGTIACGQAFDATAVLTYEPLVSGPVAVEASNPAAPTPVEVAVELTSCSPSPGVLCPARIGDSSVVFFDAIAGRTHWMFVSSFPPAAADVTIHDAPTCRQDGAVEFAPSIVRQCAPYGCDTGACRTSCASHADCATGFFCTPMGTCQ